MLDYIMKYNNPNGGGLRESEMNAGVCCANNVAEEHTAALTLQICRAMAYTASRAVGSKHVELMSSMRRI